MVITIKQRGEKWRLEISGESWEFDNREEMKTNLDVLLNIKEKFGKVERFFGKVERF